MTRTQPASVGSIYLLVLQYADGKVRLVLLKKPVEIVRGISWLDFAVGNPSEYKGRVK